MKSAKNNISVDLDDISDADQNDIQRILQDTDDLDRDLFKKIGSKSMETGMSKTLPATAFKQISQTSQKRIGFDDQKDEMESLFGKTLPSSTGQPQSRHIKSSALFDDIDLMKTDKSPTRQNTNKDFLKSGNFASDLAPNSSKKDDIFANEAIFESNQSSDGFIFGGYMPSQATSRFSKQEKFTKPDGLLNEEGNKNKIAKSSTEKPSNSNKFDFDFDFNSLVKTKTDTGIFDNKNQTTPSKNLIKNSFDGGSAEPDNLKSKPTMLKNTSSLNNSFDYEEKPLPVDNFRKSSVYNESASNVAKPRSSEIGLWTNEANKPASNQKFESSFEIQDETPEVQTTQQTIKKLEFENQELKMQLHQQKSHYETQLSLNTENYEARIKMMMEDHETYKKHQNNAKNALQAQIDILEKENSENLAKFKQKLDEKEQEFEILTEKQKKIHREAIENLKTEQQEQLLQLKKSNEAEKNAILHFNSHSRSIENVVGMIEGQARVLNEMHERIEKEHGLNMSELESQLKVKENHLKTHESRLTRQQREYENEIKLLNETVHKLEEHLAEQTKLVSEERWRVKQQEKKMEALQDALLNEQRIVMDKLARERNDIDRAKEDILLEQKRLMNQIYEEKSKIAQEKAILDSNLAAYKDKVHKDMLANVQVQAEISANKNRLKDEKSHLERIEDSLKQREEQLKKEIHLLEEKKQDLESKAANLERLALTINQKNQQAEEMLSQSNKAKEIEMKALNESNLIKQSHEGRLKLIQQQMAFLKEKEVEINNEKIGLYRQRKEIEELISKIKCKKCKGPIQKSDLPFLDIAYGDQIVKKNIPSVNSLNSSLLDAKYLKELKIQAHKEKRFLNEERQFIDTIKNDSFSFRSTSLQHLNNV